MTGEVARRAPAILAPPALVYKLETTDMHNEFRTPALEEGIFFYTKLFLSCLFHDIPTRNWQHKNNAWKSFKASIICLFEVLSSDILVLNFS